MTARLAVAAGLAALLVGAAPAAAAGPDNDDRNDATRVTRLPASVEGTLQGAGLEGPEASSPCAATSGSVWYRIDPGISRRVVVRLAADGDLDATIDVYARERSQQHLLTCDVGDVNGRAAVAFDAVRGRSYLVRVARRSNSVADSFRLGLVGVAGTRLPGTPLPAGGVSGRLDRAQRTAQAWSVSLRAGARYRIAVAHPGAGCVGALVYGPRPRSGQEPAARLGCKGYTLFTPRAGRGGRYAIVVHAQSDVRGPQRYHLELARAGADDTAPGVFIANYARVRQDLDGRGVDHVDLYRCDVTRRSVLFLHLRTGGAFDLVLLDAWGNVIRCECDGRGGRGSGARVVVLHRARLGARTARPSRHPSTSPMGVGSHRGDYRREGSPPLRPPAAGVAKRARSAQRLRAGNRRRKRSGRRRDRRSLPSLDDAVAPYCCPPSAPIFQSPPSLTSATVSSEACWLAAVVCTLALARSPLMVTWRTSIFGDWTSSSALFITLSQLRPARRTLSITGLASSSAQTRR
jgi:hypothetical protein